MPTDRVCGIGARCRGPDGPFQLCHLLGRSGSRNRTPVLGGGRRHWSGMARRRVRLRAGCAGKVTRKERDLMGTQRRRAGCRAMVAALVSPVIAASCAGVPPSTKTPVTEQRPLGALLKAAAYPNSETLLVLVTMQHLLATHREWEGYAYFGRLADEQPGRRALFRSVQASMQARVANDLPLWKRVAWVEDAIRKLDEGARAVPLLGRFARGIVFAELPARFGKGRQAIEDLEACIAHRAELPLGFDRGIYRAMAAAYRTAGDERR